MRKKYDFDLIVIGSGLAGGTAAKIVAEKGQKVAIIERDKWGGTALNSGDVAFGALANASKLLLEASDGAHFGLSSGNLRYNYPTLKSYKNLVRERAGANNKKAFEDAGITCIEGRGHIISAHEVSDGEKIWHTKKILIATGAGTLDTGINIDKNVKYLSAGDIVELPRIPKTVFVVGAGATGCEVAQYLHTMGCEVVLADYSSRILPAKDEEVGQLLGEILSDEGIKVLTQSRVTNILDDKGQRRVIFLRGGLEKSVRVDEVVLCTGHAPNTDIGLENAGVEYSLQGISVNAYMQSSAKNIYACGDITGAESSPERAEIQAQIAAAAICGHKKQFEQKALIRSVNIYPGVAEIGLTEDDCIRQDKRYKKILLPLGEIEKSNVCDFSDGFLKLLCDKAGKIIGSTIVAPNATILMQEFAFAMHHNMTIHDIAETPHAKYEWTELLKEAAAQLR